MWTPNITTPVVKMLSHRGPVNAVAFDPSGHYMATAGGVHVGGGGGGAGLSAVCVDACVRSCVCKECMKKIVTSDTCSLSHLHLNEIASFALSTPH